MSYSDIIDEARRKAAYYTVNHGLSIHQLDKIYRQEGIAYPVNDGRCIILDVSEYPYHSGTERRRY